MGTSATPPDYRLRATAVAGFTLIEITVVLVLLGLVVGLVLPNLISLYDKLGSRSELKRTLSQLSDLSLVAYATGDGGSLQDLSERHLELPNGWAIRGGETVFIRDNGVCEGGQIVLMTQSKDFPILMQAPNCEAELLE